LNFLLHDIKLIASPYKKKQRISLSKQQSLVFKVWDKINFFHKSRGTKNIMLSGLSPLKATNSQFIEYFL